MTFAGHLMEVVVFTACANIGLSVKCALGSIQPAIATATWEGLRGET